jgi:acetoacetate decarboxylase
MSAADKAAPAPAAYSTPVDSPLVPPFPVAYRNAWILTLCYRTDPAAIARLLPPPLMPAGATVMIHIYQMNDTDYLGVYNECNVMVGCRLRQEGDDLLGGYSPWLFLDSDAGLALGREVHGQPKKIAYPKVEVRGDLVVGTVDRNGITVITGTLPYKQYRADIAQLAEYFEFRENVNLKVIPNIDGSTAIRQLTSRRLSEVTVHECWRGDCSVELRPNAQAPVWRLPVVDALEGYYWNADFKLVPGRIIHDYLSGKGANA